MQTDWLGLTAFAIGLTHTLLGPDHYIPFVAMSRAGNWTLRRTLIVTWLCGIGHVAGSVALGMLALAGGLAAQELGDLESQRGDWAAWLLIGFGSAYAAWGIRQAVRSARHTHFHGHSDGTWHSHDHGHDSEHLHVHERATQVSSPRTPTKITPWALFVIFALGPCEPLVPLFFVPASQRNYGQAAWIATLFSLATLVAMTACVIGLRYGVGLRRWPKLEQFSHALAGLAVLACGVAVKLGL